MAEKRLNVLFSRKLAEGRKPPSMPEKSGPVTFLHDAEVSQADGALKVSSFKEERLTPQ